MSNEQTYTLKQGSCHTFVCNPSKFRDAAVEAMKLHDQLDVIAGNCRDDIFVRVSSSTQFVGSFDTPDYEVTEIIYRDVLFDTLTMAPASVLDGMKLTENETDYEYVIHYIYKMFGQRPPSTPLDSGEKDVYVVLSYNILQNLGLANHTSRDPKNTLQRLRSPAKLIRGQRILFNTSYNSHPVMNPLNYNPIGSTVAVVKARDLSSVLVRDCVRDEASRLKVDLICRFVNLWIEMNGRFTI